MEDENSIPTRARSGCVDGTSVSSSLHRRSREVVSCGLRLRMERNVGNAEPVSDADAAAMLTPQRCSQSFPIPSH